MESPVSGWRLRSDVDHVVAVYSVNFLNTPTPLLYHWSKKWVGLSSRFYMEPNETHPRKESEMHQFLVYATVFLGGMVTVDLIKMMTHELNKSFNRHVDEAMDIIRSETPPHN